MMAGESGPKVGEKAPDFSGVRNGGEQVSPNDHIGEAVVLYFYPKDDTSGCTKEAIEFTGLLDEFEKPGARVFGISRDSIKKHDRFRDKHDLKVDLISDESGAITEGFGVWVEKSMYGKTYMGIERSTFLIDRAGKIARIWKKVKVPGHAAEVLSAVKELQ